MFTVKDLQSYLMKQKRGLKNANAYATLERIVTKEDSMKSPDAPKHSLGSIRTASREIELSRSQIVSFVNASESKAVSETNQKKRSYYYRQASTVLSLGKKRLSKLERVPSGKLVHCHYMKVQTVNKLYVNSLIEDDLTSIGHAIQKSAHARQPKQLSLV